MYGITTKNYLDLWPGRKGKEKHINGIKNLGRGRAAKLMYNIVKDG